MNIENESNIASGEKTERKNLEGMALNSLQLQLMINMAGGDRNEARAHVIEWIRDHGFSFRTVVEIWPGTHPDQTLDMELDSLDQVERDLEIIENIEDRLGINLKEEENESQNLRQIWEKRYGSRFKNILLENPDLLIQYENGDENTKTEIVEKIKFRLNS